MVHSVLWLRRLASHFRGKQVVLLVFCGNDLADIVRPAVGCSRMPYVRQRADGPWQLRTDHIDERPWPVQAQSGLSDLGFAAPCTPSAYNNRIFAGRTS